MADTISVRDPAIELVGKKNKKCDQKPIEHAIMELISDHDFDGYLLTHFDCRIVESIMGDGPQTAALIYQNGRFFIRVVEEFFLKLTDDERVSIMKHEIAHFIMKHMTRRNGRDPYLFNIGADMAINQNIPHMPKDCVDLPYGWKPHLSMEEYYDKLLKKVQQGAGTGGPPGEGGQSQDDDEGQQQGGGGGSDKNKLQLPKQFDSVMDAPDSEAGDAESMTDEVIKEVIKEQLDAGIDSSKLRGLYAGALEEYIDELTKPPLIDWRHALTRFAATLADQYTRRTLKRPDRRNEMEDSYGKKREYLPSLVIIIDSSGSVSTDMLSTFLSQIALLGRMLSQVHVIIADAAVQEHFTFTRGMEERLREAGSGRGGTDFDPAVKYINENLRDCDGAIYLTDGWCPAPETKCKIPMLWIVTENEDYEGRPRIMAPDIGKDKGRR